jgi:two-component system, cell cycle sensor histidine kinase and response regulator CckA
LRLCESYIVEIHFVITDMIMPQMSGAELIDRITALSREITVLYIFCYSDNAIPQSGVLDLQVPFLQKPFTPATLAGSPL